MGQPGSIGVRTGEDLWKLLSQSGSTLVDELVFTHSQPGSRSLSSVLQKAGPVHAI